MPVQPTFLPFRSAALSMPLPSSVMPDQQPVCIVSISLALAPCSHDRKKPGVHRKKSISSLARSSEVSAVMVTTLGSMPLSSKQWFSIAT